MFDLIDTCPLEYIVIVLIILIMVINKKLEE
jgi:hypothetical protein